MRAVVFSRRCSATVGFDTHVAVIVVATQLNEVGNVVILKGEVPLTLRRQSESELVISRAGSAEQFKREEVIDSVRIRYEQPTSR
jgi:hypothetical protein